MLKAFTVPVISKMRSWWEHKVLFEPKDWVQMEVTSACNAACVYCPRTVFRRAWQDRSMSLETFKRLLPALRKTSLAYLQGWGEPLLHPGLPDMIRLSKGAGCDVGITTNGMPLTKGLCTRLMDAGLDILAFSLAGTTPERNDAARPGTSLKKVLEKLAMVRRIKQERGSKTPSVHIAYMLLRSGMDDLEGLPRLMADHGVDQAVVSVLDFKPGPELSGEILAPRNQSERAELEARFLWLRASAEERSLTIHTPDFGLKIEGGSDCSENIGRSLFVSADGEVSPCVYANVPVDRAEYARQGEPASYRRVTFGNINREFLPVVWRKPEYARFRADLSQGRPPEICLGCPKRLR